MKKMKFSRDKIYFDYAATTPMDPLVKKAMEPYFFEKFGNPSSIHSFGQEAMAIVDESREKIANIIGASPVGGFQEIIFTGSATEANNLALRGIIKKFRIKNLELRDPLYSKSYILNPRIIVSAIEHESILETCRDLEKDGIEIIYLPVNKQGIVDLNKLKESLNERTILVSVMYANNEIGTIQPISAIAEIVKEFRIKNLEFRNKKNPQSSILNPQFYPLFHTDAVQAFQFLDCDINKLWVDLMTLSGHKIYGPKGIGLLYAKNLEFRIKDLGIKNKKILNPQSLILLLLAAGRNSTFARARKMSLQLRVLAKPLSWPIKIAKKKQKEFPNFQIIFGEKSKKYFQKLR
ncbi:aminotransferase class V-fold PLP-dependent enzyme [Candidatus Wolfebacteria bacterium]|nr:aminotransferase class V-fold PLP-dependent enzyme [Candidatus Wolfebacteria bacterium]